MGPIFLTAQQPVQTALNNFDYIFLNWKFVLVLCGNFFERNL